MPDFICPFTNSKCKDTCEYWIPENAESSQNSIGIIPFTFSIDDIIDNIADNKLKDNKKYYWMFLLWKKYKNVNNISEKIFPNKSGKCSRLE